jgi:hypothetical protein
MGRTEQRKAQRYLARTFIWLEAMVNHKKMVKLSFRTSNNAKSCMA